MKCCELCDSWQADEIEQCECGSFCFTSTSKAAAVTSFSENTAGDQVERLPYAASGMTEGVRSERKSQSMKATPTKGPSATGCGFVAAAAAIGGLWVLKWLFEQFAQDQAKQLLGSTGDLGSGIFFIAVGLGLLFGGPVCMKQINRERLGRGRKQKYGLLEHSIVFVGGLGFTVVGIALLFWPSR